MYVDDDFVKEYDDLITERIAQAKIKGELAEEIRLTIYARIMNSDNYDPEKGKVSTWIYMICRSVISNTVRKYRSSTDALDQHCPDLSQAHNKIGQEDAGDLGDELERLFKTVNISARDKNIVRDVHLRGYTVLEAANKHKMKYYAVEKALSRALKALREAAED